MIQTSLLQFRGKDHFQLRFSQDFSQGDEISAEPPRRMGSQ